LGTLIITIVSAKDLKPPSAVGKSDPYVKVRIGGTEMVTAVIKDAANNPTFNETFRFEISTEKEVAIEVWDKEAVGNDKMVGGLSTSFMGWIGKGSFDGDLDIKDDKAATAGSVKVRAAFERPAATGPAAPVGPAGPRGVPMNNGTFGPPPPVDEPARDPKGKFTDKEIKEAFMAFDLDHNNFVGAAEIRHVLVNIGENVTDEEVDEMIRMVDKDGDGQVSFDEFYEMVTGGKAPPAGLWDGPGAGVVQPGMAGSSPEEDGAASVAGGRPASAGSAPVIQQRNQRKTALEDFAKEYNIKPESIKKAYKRFQETDVDHSGLIDYAEFCEILQVDPAPQVEKLFQMFDRDRSGQIDVKEFMIGLSNFTGAGKEEKLKFAFMVFDEDGNGVITKQELLKILKANHMASSDKEVIRKAETIMMQADKDGDGVINFDEFVVVSKKFPNILFPAYSLGQRLQQKMGV